MLLKIKKERFFLKYNLKFISDKDLFEHVKETVLKYRFKINLKQFNKNIIDPIKLTFDSKVYKKTLEDVIESEILRQKDKSNNNQIGYFNQNIFKYIGKGWQVPSQGFDIVNYEKKIYVEMKNKHNTMNSSSSQKTYIQMQNKILKQPDATCMLVEVISKKSQNIEWKVSVNNKQASHKQIRRVSIDKFYELVTGDKNSFRDLCQVLPKVIDDVLEKVSLNKDQNTVFKELKAISPNLFKSIFLLSFKKYEGFNEFNI